MGKLSSIDYLVTASLGVKEDGTLKRAYYLERPYLQKTEEGEDAPVTYDELASKHGHEDHFPTVDTLAHAIAAHYKEIIASPDWIEYFDKMRGREPSLRIQNVSGGRHIGSGTLEISDFPAGFTDDIDFTAEFEHKNSIIGTINWRPLSGEEWDALYVSVAKYLSE